MTCEVGYLGPAGTFSEQAAGRWMQHADLPAATLRPAGSISALVEQLKSGSLDYGVIPFENSIEGTVNLALDILIKRDVLIVGEAIIGIEHCLAAQAGTATGAIKAVVSHEQALAQCYEYLAANFPRVELIKAESTGEAARIVAAGPQGLAAICAEQAAVANGLEVKAAGIQDYFSNKTRFLILGKKAPAPTGHDKTSLVFALPENRPGALYQALKSFAEQNVNLTKIESRPTKKDLGEYYFYVDCEGHVQHEELRLALQSLSSQAALIKVLGSYPKDMASRNGETK